jgi:hypothetical protein
MRKLSVIIFLLSLPLAESAYAVEAQQVIWGYDGKVIPERVNLLSVLLSNQEETPYEGAIVVYKTDPIGRRIGAQLVQPCFISPYSSRWVQFFVYVSEDWTKWIIAWGEGARDRIEAPAVRFGPPARIYLDQPDSPFSAKANFKTFPENLFPPTAAGADALDSVILDHCPRWEPLRQKAFLSWLNRGGTLHLLKTAEGKYPQFPPDMAELNNPADRFSVGEGEVVRHSLAQQALTEQVLTGMGFPAPELKTSDNPSIHRLEDHLFNLMKSLDTPERNWTLIVLLALMYMVLLCPVNYLFGRKRGRDFWVTILFLTALVASFSFIFYEVGHRGYGETTHVYTLSYARPLSDDTYDVTQWSSVFVTSGGYYTISHPSPYSIYSVCEESELVNGIISNGKGGNFSVDIPLYSSRAFLHRGELKGDNTRLEVVEWEVKDGLKKLSLAPQKGFPEDILEMWVLYDEHFYKMTLADGLIKIASEDDTGKHIDDFLSRYELSSFDYYYGSYSRAREEPGELFRSKALRPLIAYALGGRNVFSQYVESAKISRNDRAQIFIFARSPETFHLTGKGLGKDKSWVLYHREVANPRLRKE